MLDMDTNVHNRDQQHAYEWDMGCKTDQRTPTDPQFSPRIVISTVAKDIIGPKSPDDDAGT